MNRDSAEQEDARPARTTRFAPSACGGEEAPGEPAATPSSDELMTLRSGTQLSGPDAQAEPAGDEPASASAALEAAPASVAVTRARHHSLTSGGRSDASYGTIGGNSWQQQQQQ